MSDRELLRFESMNDMRKLPTQKVGGDNIPSMPWVTVTTSNASICVKLSCNFFMKMAKGSANQRVPLTCKQQKYQAEAPGIERWRLKRTN